MKIIFARNVCEALPAGLAYLAAEGRWEDSRAGRVIVAPGPVATVYAHPRERVLFSALRDANPVFHLAESLWMLAGRDDAAFLDNFVKDFGARFAEPDGKVHDAYGYRWRQLFGYDQLDAAVKQLSDTPGSRQAVIAMWDAGSMPSGWSHLEPSEDLRGVWATRPCNTHAYLRIREEGTQRRYVGGLVQGTSVDTPAYVLDITVCCRSNDIVWGAYGSNSVHFSVLQEYLAARLDVGVGTYVQFSHNYHCYEDQFKRLQKSKYFEELLDNRYATQNLQPAPLVHDAESFDEECKELLMRYENHHPAGQDVHNSLAAESYHNKFLSQTVWPMLMAHRAWRGKNYSESASWLDWIEAPDWRAATREWVERRIK